MQGNGGESWLTEIKHNRVEHNIQCKGCNSHYVRQAGKKLTEEIYEH